MGTTTTYYGLYKPANGEEGYDDEINASMDAIDLELHDLSIATGVQVLTGTTAPSNGLGNNGDIYFRSNGGVYTKAAGVWTLQFTMPGTAGATGASFLAGTGAPSNALGNNGDTYMDRATGNLYSPKAAGAWPAVSGSLLGPIGASGPTAELKATFSNAGSSIEIDTADASVFDLTLTDDLTVTDILDNGTNVPVVTFILRQGGTGSNLINWPDSVAWPLGAAPTLSTTPGAKDLVTMMWDGNEWLAGNLIGGSEAPAPTLPTLDVDIVGTIEGTPGQLDASSYTTTQTFSGGSQGAVAVFVITTQTGADPLVPILIGGGYGTTWSLLGSPERFDANDTGTRRLLTCHMARASSAGAAAPLSVEYRTGNTSGGTLTAQSGCLLAAVQIDGTPVNGVALAGANAQGDHATAQGGTGGDSTHITLAMGTPVDTDGLFLMCVGTNTNTAAAAITPEAGWTLVASSGITHGSPTTQMYLYTKATSDTTFTATFAAGVIHAEMGIELVQG
jgi:hypothetical protein